MRANVGKIRDERDQALTQLADARRENERLRESVGKIAKTYRGRGFVGMADELEKALSQR